MSEAKPIVFEEIRQFLRLTGSGLERKHKQTGMWQPVQVKPNSAGYQRLYIGTKHYAMHRLVYSLAYETDVPEYLQIDHIDGDTANNTIMNLRLVTVRENQQNQKIHREGRLPGCYWHKHTGKWCAAISIGQDRKHLGLFKTELEAHEAYCMALASLEN